MYKSLIVKHLSFFTYVTFILICTCTYAQENTKSRTDKIKLAEKYARDLGANSYKIRKSAIKGLIELGYYSRKEVQKLINSDDPEIKENAKMVWEKIKWAVTETNPELVNDFIKKFNNQKAQLDDWVDLVEKCGNDSVDVLIEIKKLNKDLPAKVQIAEPDPFEDPFAEPNIINDPFEPRSFDITTMMPVILYKSNENELIESLKGIDKEKKLFLKDLLAKSFVDAAPYIQSRIINLSSSIFSSEFGWSFYSNAHISSNYIKAKMSPQIIDYALKDFQNFEGDDKIRAILLLFTHKKLSLQAIEAKLPIEAFLKSQSATQKVFYDQLASKMSLENIQALLKNGKEAWHKYKLMSLKKAPDAATLTKTFKSIFENGGDIVEFVEENFPPDSIQAIPFYKIAAQMESKEDDWFLYSTSATLLWHSQRTGDFDAAIKYLIMFNDENHRPKDSNEAFYQKQKTAVKKETQEILRQVQALHNEPKKALELLNKAETLNPEVLTVKIQKLEVLIKLKKLDEAKKGLKALIKSVPQNLLEIRELIHVCWELDDKDSASELITKLSLGEEDFGNVSLASSSFEFFLQMNEMLKQQDTMQLNTFGQVRVNYYKQKFEDIPGLCKSPEEGDFQYIWGVSAMKKLKGQSEALSYFSRRIFDEHWPEMLALASAGKISPEEIIDEAKSELSLVERKGQLTEAYYYAGCIYLKQGNKKKALELFQKAKDLRFYEYYEYVSAAVMLKTLK